MHLILLGMAAAAFSQTAVDANNPRSAAEQEVVAPVEVKFTFKEKKPVTDQRSPDYVRCRSKPVIGSLVKKKRVCMTNREWKVANLEGSKRSRQLVEDLQVGMNNNGM